MRHDGMEADRAAPAFGESEIRVAASPETVWDVLADVEGWPRWNPDVRLATLDGEVAEGTTFRWKSGPGTIVSTFRLVERPTSLGWTGRTFGIRAIHVWRFEAVGGDTRIRTEESFDGLLARVLRRSLRKTLRRTLDTGLRHLKAEAERR